MIAITIAAALAAGCLTSRYQPRSYGRVAVVMRGGQKGYVRDGVFYPAGMFGKGLATAVSGDPEAVRLAKRFRDRSSTGFWMGLGGLLCAEGAAIYSVAQTVDDPAAEPSPVALGVVVGCVVLSGYGFWMMFDAVPDELDAINLFNDNAAERVTLPGQPRARP